MSVPAKTTGTVPTSAPEHDRDYGDIAERVVIQGDLSKLTPEERIRYYLDVCRSLGLNHRTRPFEYMTLQGKLTLYAKAGATDQLREKRKISVSIVSRERTGDLYVVTARAKTKDGRVDESTGVVSLTGLKGDDLANRLMKAETKSKRRVTLSICGLGFMDESEVGTIRDAQLMEEFEPGKTLPSLPSLPLLPPVSLGPPSDPRLTGDQLGLLLEFVDHFGWEPDTIRNRLRHNYRVERFEDLARDQAQELLDGLINKYGSPKQWGQQAEADEERPAIQEEGVRS
jgi:hypothetical protein